MTDGLTNFNKICKNCKQSKHISKFITNKRKCQYCYECRDIMYARCNICGFRKRRVEMDRIEESTVVCKKCTSKRSEITDIKFKEAFSIMDNFYNLKGNINVIHANKSVQSEGEG